MDPNKKISIEQIKAALSSPEVQNAKPEDLISTISGMFGLDIEPLDQEEANKIRNEYFQAITLDKDEWTRLPGLRNYVQIAPFKLKEIPPSGAVVADVLIDKSDYEAECFDKYVKSMSIRGKTIVFYASSELPVNIVVGLKCVNQVTKEIIAVPPEYFRKGK